jgi:hypothetical protein
MRHKHKGPLVAGRRRRESAAMKAMLLAMACTTLGLAGAPDLAPPGMRLVRNEAVVDWPDTLAAVRFVVAPAQSPTRRHELVRGEAFPVPRGPFANARIFAVPADAGELPRDRDAWTATGWPSAPLPATLLHSVPAASAIHRVRTDVAIDGIDGATIRCRAVRRSQLDHAGNPAVVPSALVPALAALAGLALLVRFARQRRGATP